ncbi:MAG: PBP1A family penicillin-binding protein [Alphaproteobacteria bacterium]|uniref:transglycosylase domain-containing protein n=1 Tax=Maricaulis alexandrii TaxID=2570354 RepID=UPI0011081F77|nr:PBP1A family penicillin-binding protein [Maricaulis alexandrii]MCR9266168.1 PBP1A family penicillin-binding protein [Alphaproteobacteria bacterium]
MARRSRTTTSASRRRPRAVPARRPAKRSAKSRFPWLRSLTVLTLLVSLGVGGYLVSVARDLPDTSGLTAVEPAASITYLDHRDRLIARRGSAQGHEVNIEDLPPYLIDAVLAVEDRRFYSHPGIDVIGLSRAMLANIRAGHVVQGGSTLTQQLAKNLFLSPERTLRRKVQEMMLAFWLESRFTKDEILELYLNRVYFGGGAYGVEAASLRYFGRSASEVSLGEAALLAGLLKAPSRYSPVNDAARAAARATVVLDLMAQTGRITESERVAAAEVPIRVSRGASSPGAQYFIDWIAPQVRELVGDGHGDLIVHTTLDVDAQRAAESALNAVLADAELASGAGEGALVSLAHDGSVRALVGGRSYVRSQFNRAILAQRQPGSAFKPFVYASAFEAGLRPDDVRTDAPVRVGDWEPQNYNDTYRGELTLREAFYRSSNSVAVQIAEETGRGHVARLARRLGLSSSMRVDRSLALGAYEVTPLELATAYTPFANGGFRAEAHGIAWIETADGEVLYTPPAPPSELVLDARTSTHMRDLMRAVVREGTGRNAAVWGLDAAGKTGTTNEFRDAWFAGYAGDLVTVVWTGNDDNSPTDHATGGGPPARIFGGFMREAPREGLGSQPPRTRSLITPVARDAAEASEAAPGSDLTADAQPAQPEETESDPIAAFLASLGGPDSE